MSEKPRQESRNPHDQFVRKVFADVRIAGDFLRSFVELPLWEQADLAGLKRIETHHFGLNFDEFFADLAYELPMKDGSQQPILIFVEHKSYHDRFVTLQLLVYLSLWWYQSWNDAKRPKRPGISFRLVAPLPILLYHGQKPWGEPPTLESLIEMRADVEPFMPKFRPYLIDLAAVSYDDLHRRVMTPESRLISEGLKSASERQFRERLDEMLSHLVGVPLDDRIVQLMNHFLIYGNSVSELSAAVVDSALAKTFGAEEVKRMKGTLLDDIRNEGVVIGMQQGMQQGILYTLERRLQLAQVPDTIRTKMESITDVEHLRRLTDAAWDCANLDEFCQALDDLSRKPR